MRKKSNLSFQSLQKQLDLFWQKTLIRILPQAITPNLLSIIRLALIPLILWLILEKHYSFGLLLFIFTALTDSLDGALARYRRQITSLGLILDPLSDKLLIIGSLVIFLERYPFPDLIFYLILFESMVIAITYAWVRILKRQPLASNSWGKFKMTFQSLGVVTVFVWLITQTAFSLYISAIFLWLSLVFLIASAIYPFTKKS